MPALTVRTSFILLLVLPGMTAAQKQEAPSAKTGIDPTDIRTRIEAAYTYNERANGVTRQNFNLRLEREFTGRELNVRIDIPYIYADIPDMSSQTGVGDIGLRLNYRYRHTRGYSALVGATLTLDTAAGETLGDGTTKVTGVWVNSWRRQAWMLSTATLATWSDSGEHDSAGVVPLVAYQPMRKYWSYVTVGVPVVRDLDDDETITLALLRIGKVFANRGIAYLGTRIDLSGNADDDLVITLGYRYLFD